MREPGLTILNSYALRATRAEFDAAIAALADRVERSGHPGVLSYRFFAHQSRAQARAVIDYEDAAAWIGHHEIAMAWPEMQRLHAVASLQEVTFLGHYTAEIDDWLAASGLSVTVDCGYDFAAGFRREQGRR